VLKGAGFTFPSPPLKKFFVWFGRLIPALFFSATFFLAIENFTYTLFRFGLKTIPDTWRFGYFVIYLVLFAYALQLVIKTERFILKGWHLKGILLLCGALFSGLGIGLFTGQSLSWEPNIGHLPSVAASGRASPNILMLSTDGLNADHTSVYGYFRDTTPFIREFIKGKALFCENAFTNASNTGGSVTSTLTGKLPTRTRVYYPPEILKGVDRYEHFPGILKSYGYHNIDVSIRQFADAHDMNLLNGFDIANGRTLSNENIPSMLMVLLVPGMKYFINSTYERLKNRISYSLGLRNQVDSHNEASGKKGNAANSDSGRIRQFFSWIDQTDQPFFAHVHLMDTHGPRFHPRKRVFSKGKEQKSSWMTDFYDDAILDFDAYTREIIYGLKARGRYQNTVVVIGSDHGFQFNTRVRIPLIFLFPDGSHSRRVKTNTQNLDIAPTLLEYLGLPKPDWMQGHSFLNSDPAPDRYIFSTGVNPNCVNPKKWLVDSSKTGPPFYSLGFLSVSVCDNYYQFSTIDRTLIRQKIPGHTAPCIDADPPRDTAGREIIFKHLTQNGYSF